MLNMRDNLLIEKVINETVFSYNNSRKNGYPNAEVDFKLDIIAFINDNTKDHVDYGLNYLQQYYKEECDILRPILLEYKTFGLTEQLQTKMEEPIQEPKLTWFQKILNWFNKKENTNGPTMDEASVQRGKISQ